MTVEVVPLVVEPVVFVVEDDDEAVAVLTLAVAVCPTLAVPVCATACVCVRGGAAVIVNCALVAVSCAE